MFNWKVLSVGSKKDTRGQRNRVQDENLPAPEILAHEIVEILGVALEQFESIVEELENPANPK